MARVLRAEKYMPRAFSVAFLWLFVRLVERDAWKMGEVKPPSAMVSAPRGPLGWCHHRVLWYMRVSLVSYKYKDGYVPRGILRVLETKLVYNSPFPTTLVQTTTPLSRTTSLAGRYPAACRSPTTVFSRTWRRSCGSRGHRRQMVLEGRSSKACVSSGPRERG